MAIKFNEITDVVSPGLGVKLLACPESNGTQGITLLSSIKAWLEGFFSLVSHTHDAAYSALGHNHDTEYSDLVHDHDTDYSALTHDHDTDYSALGHNHDADYSAIGHNHDTDYADISYESTVDTHIANHPSGAAPTGAIMMWPTSSAPSGWLLCNGQEVARSGDLGTLLGDTYGVGNGTTTYNVPDFRGVFPWGIKASGNALGDTGGEEAHTLTVAELASHSGHQLTLGYWTAGGTAGVAANAVITGSNVAHNTLPPYLVINFIIKE